MNVHQAVMSSIRRMLEFTRSDAFDETDLASVVIRLERLEEVWIRYNEVHREMLEAIVGDDIVALEESMANAEQSYFEAKTAFRRRTEFLEREAVVNQPQPEPAGAQAMTVQFQMPFQQHDVKNTWGIDGNLLKWQGFHDRFVAAVHNNDQINAAYNFSYLKKSLMGHALLTLGEWQLTDANYQEAWERLGQLYAKKYHICREHLRQFTKLPPIQGQLRSNDLQKMSNVTHEVLRQLRAQDLPVQHWDMFIVHMLHERLDSETGRLWELQRESDTPTAAEMLAFLDKQAAAIAGQSNAHRDRSQESARAENSRAEGSRAESNRNEKGKVDKSRYNRLESERRVQQRDDSSSSSRRPAVSNHRSGRVHECPACRSTHQLFDCPEFISLDLPSRKALVTAQRLCPNCFKRGHGVDDCFLPKCPRCPNNPPHNSLLCPTRAVNPVTVAVESTSDGDKKARKRKTKDKHD